MHIFETQLYASDLFKFITTSPISFNFSVLCEMLTSLLSVLMDMNDDVHALNVIHCLKFAALLLSMFVLYASK